MPIQQRGVMITYITLLGHPMCDFKSVLKEYGGENTGNICVKFFVACAH